MQIFCWKSILTVKGMKVLFWKKQRRYMQLVVILLIYWIIHAANFSFLKKNARITQKNKIVEPQSSNWLGLILYCRRHSAFNFSCGFLLVWLDVAGRVGADEDVAHYLAEYSFAVERRKPHALSGRHSRTTTAYYQQFENPQFPKQTRSHDNAAEVKTTSAA